MTKLLGIAIFCILLTDFFITIFRENLNLVQLLIRLSRPLLLLVLLWFAGFWRMI